MTTTKQEASQTDSLERIRFSTNRTSKIRSLWPRVVESIEDALPLYEQVSEAISLGVARKARKIGVMGSNISDQTKVLDAGVGPGTLSRLILENSRPAILIGLDASASLLRFASKALRTTSFEGVHLVRAVFEYLPLRQGILDRILTAFSFRDAMDMDLALSEYRRVLAPKGILTVIDVSKPASPVKRVAAWIYIHAIMPIISRYLTLRVMKRDPFRMIIPTYDLLPTTAQIMTAIEERVGKATLKQYLLGGISVIFAQRDVAEGVFLA